MHIEPHEVTVVILAAGHGKRMLPLTEYTPKPLLKVGKQSLIEHHLRRLAEQGFINIVINVAYLADKIINTLGDGARYGVKIRYSDESSCGALETAGGLQNALPLIESDPFITVNADIWTDFDFTQLLKNCPKFAKLVMATNPNQNIDGDFVLGEDKLLSIPSKQPQPNEQQLAGTKQSNLAKALTFSGIAIYRRKVIESLPSGKAALAPVFRELISEQKLEGELLDGVWHDIGTPKRLTEIREIWESKLD